MTLMEAEIAAQPEALRHAAEKNEKVIAAFVEAVKARGIKHILLAARGSSDNACNYFKYLAEIYAGIPVSFAAPSVITLYDGALDLSGTAVIGVSQSGAAADVISVVERARNGGGVTAAITNNPASPLAAAAQFVVDMDVGEEKSVAATKTYTAQMYLLSLIADALAGGKITALAEAPALIGKTIRESRADAERAAARFKDVVDCYVLARGIMYAAAQECSLKIQETSYTHSRAYAISDFYHGPFAVIGEGTRVIMLAAAGAAEKDNADMLLKLTEAGADVTVFTSDPTLQGGAARIRVPAADEAIAPFAFVAAGQMFALSLSLARGLNPDAPRGLKKVTVTK